MLHILDTAVQLLIFDTTETWKCLRASQKVSQHNTDIYSTIKTAEFRLHSSESIMHILMLWQYMDTTTNSIIINSTLVLLQQELNLTW